MEQLGQPLSGYEGVAHVKFEDDGQRIEWNGYFEAGQFRSGRITITFVPTDPGHPTQVTLHTATKSELTFAGQAQGGWELKTIGDTFFSRLGWLLGPISKPPVELVVDAELLEAKRQGALESGYTKTRFLVSNFLWHDYTHDNLEPIKLDCQGFRAWVNPVHDYSEVAHRLVDMHEVGPTALVTVECPQGNPRHLQQFKDFMDDLMYVFRLASGNGVDWYYGEAFDGNTDEPMERVHKYTAMSPYSNTVRFRRLRAGQHALHPKLDLSELVEAFFNTPQPRLDRNTFKTLIDHFTHACGVTPYLEPSGLLASTLTELIVAKHADDKGLSDRIPQDKFKDEVLPALQTAIADTDLSKEIQEFALSSLKGVYRNTFRRRLKLLVDDFDLPLTAAQRDRIVNIRNDLVHRGVYPSEFYDGGWSNDYRFTIWTNLIALCRLIGYQGELPQYREGRQLEV